MSGKLVSTALHAAKSTKKWRDKDLLSKLKDVGPIVSTLGCAVAGACVTDEVILHEEYCSPVVLICGTMIGAGVGMMLPDWFPYAVVSCAAVASVTVVVKRKVQNYSGSQRYF